MAIKLSSAVNKYAAATTANDASAQLRMTAQRRNALNAAATGRGFAHKVSPSPKNSAVGSASSDLVTLRRS